MHHHLAASGNLGQVIKKSFPMTIGNRLGACDAQQLEAVSVVGSLCTPLDRFAEDLLLPRSEVGDLLVVFQSGAYGASSSPQRFLSHPEAVELCP